MIDQRITRKSRQLGLELPISRRGHITNYLRRYIAWDKGFHGVGNETVGKLGVFPKIFPCICLGCPRLVDEIAPNLDMTSKDDWSFWNYTLGNGDKTRHLRVIDNQYIRSSLRWWT